MSSIPANVVDVLVELGGSTVVVVVTADVGVVASGDELVACSAAEVGAGGGGGVGDRQKLDCTIC